ncbi:hypothetical protein FS842_005248 [Serendipita sp. 407]|nr:hypothetical protein FS842_005248 [Serendipita sp. 407]
MDVDFICFCGKLFDTQRKLQIHRTQSIKCKSRWTDEVASFGPPTAVRPLRTQADTPNVPESSEMGIPITSLVPQSILDDGYSNYDDDEEEEEELRRYVAGQAGDEVLGYEYQDGNLEDDPIDTLEEELVDDNGQEMELDDNMQEELPQSNESTSSYRDSNLSRNLSEPVESDSLHTETYSGAGRIFDKTQPHVCAEAKHQIKAGKGNIFYPFANEVDFELGLWLHESGLSISKIDSFLKLQYVQVRKPSFGSGATLRDRVELLPGGTSRWKEAKVHPISGRTSDSVVLLYRDPLGVIQELFSRPSLAPYLEFAPKRVWSDNSKRSRIYSEISTGEWWWDTQAKLPSGSTVIPIILGSDKTHLTQFTGDKKAWPIYMSVGNISSRARQEAASNAWAVIAYIPIVTWNDEKEIHGALSSRLFHQCMEMVLKPLVEAGTTGINLVDSIGNVRRSYPLVASYLADYPEQIMVNCAAGKTSPTTQAGPHDLGNMQRAEPRTTEWVLDQIRHVTASINPQDVSAYTARARKHLLNGVYQPFWEKLPFFRVDSCTAPDIFHSVIRFWRDHLFKWIVNLIGGAEVDARLKVLQPITGFCQFSKGITHLSQWTGREDRDLQRVFVALIEGAKGVNSQVMRNVRAFHDFLYLIQYRSHSGETLHYIEEALATFHETKGVYIEKKARRGKNGVIDHFKIPKLAVFHEFVSHIKQMGSSPQFSTEAVERNHKSMVKQPFLSSSRYGYGPQMCRYLDRKERVRHTRELLDWIIQQQLIDRRQEAISTWSPKFQARIQRQLFTDPSGMPLTRLQENRKNKLVWLNLTPSYTGLSLSDVSIAYDLSSLQAHVNSYLCDTFDSSRPGCGDVINVDVWESLHIRNTNVQDDSEFSQIHTLHALPPGAERGRYPHGHGHFVLIHDSKHAQDVGIEGQLRLIFRLHLQPGLFESRNQSFGQGRRVRETPNVCTVDLAYVEFLKLSQNPDEDTLMYRVQREASKSSRRGEIVGLDAIARFVQLIPRFGRRITKGITAETSMEVYRSFHINSFATSQIFQAVY